MPRRKRKQITSEHVKNVHTLIENCVQRYLSKEEAVQELQRLEIEPDFTKLVWQKLEEENELFFKYYHSCFAWDLEKLQLNKFQEKKSQSKELMHLTASASLPPNSNLGLTPVASPPTVEGSHNPAVSSQPNSNFDAKYNPAVLSQPNLGAIASPPTFDGSHNPAVSSQPNSNIDASYNPAVLSQPNSNFDASYNLNMAHIPAMPEYPACYYTGEQIQEGLMPTNIQLQHLVYSSSYDVLNNGGSSLPQSMHDVVDVSICGNGNLINDPSNMFST